MPLLPFIERKLKGYPGHFLPQKKTSLTVQEFSICYNNQAAFSKVVSVVLKGFLSIPTTKLKTTVRTLGL